MGRYLLPARVVAVGLVVVAMASLSMRAVSTWLLWHKEVDRCTPPPNGTEFTSPWHFTFPLLLFALLTVLGSLSFLREPRSTSRSRGILELAYVGLALYIAWFLWEAIYLVYNPFHSGPVG